MLIAVDVDGVLCDFDSGVRYWCFGRFGYVPKEATGWGMMNMAKPHFEEFWETAGKNPDFWAGLPPYRDAVAFFQMAMRGLDYVLVSNCPSWDGRRRWLERWEFGLFARATILQPPNTSKLDLLTETLHADIVVEDNGETVQQALSAGMSCVLFKHPWNDLAQAIIAATQDELRGRSVSGWYELAELRRKGEWPKVKEQEGERTEDL